VENFLQGEVEVSLNGRILLLGAATMETTETHAQVTVHTIVKFCAKVNSIV
jgi:hypothetical protein